MSTPIWYCYEKSTGTFAGAGTPQIDDDTYGSTLDAPVFNGDRCVQTFTVALDRWQTTWLPGGAFALRFTPQEIADAEVSTDSDVQLALAALKDAPWVWLNAPETQAGVGALVTAGIVTPERAAIILAPAD
jgi:hypothetical protein